MTFQEFIDYLRDNPMWIVFYFSIIPVLALIADRFDEDRGHETPWNYLYAVLIYGVSVPGIFAVALDVYLFLFEKRSIFDTEILTQVLPVLSMIMTLLIIRRNVDLDYIPGFDRLSGLMMIIATVMALMWVVDRTRIIAITYLPFGYVVIIFIVLLVLLRYGWSMLFSSSGRS